jgi:predicted RNase H-like HicB family nuclease
MPKKSTRSAAKGTQGAALDRPFEPELLRRARGIASNYGFLIQPHPDVGYLARGLEMPNVFADARTVEACVREIREALTVATATLLEMGETPPSPAGGQQERREQINIRLTAEEKLRLEEAARSKGFRGISDFVRTTTLGELR